GKSALRDALAARQVICPDMIIDGPKNSDGQPTWMGFTTDQVDINASSQDIRILIGGYLGRIRGQKAVELSGSADTYYIFAEYEPDGVVVVDGDSDDGTPSEAKGTTSDDTDSVPRIFTDDDHADWTALDVKVGDILELITG